MYELIPELKVQPRDRLRSERFPICSGSSSSAEKHRGMYSMNEVMDMAVRFGGVHGEAGDAFHP